VKIAVRRVDIADRLVTEAIATMFKDTFTKGNPWCGKIRPSRGDWWIALVDSKEAGFAGMVPSHKAPNAGYLCASGVLPEYRGNGIQKRLLRARIAQARKYGWTELRTETINDNPASANALIACGFRCFTPEKAWGSPYAVYWRKAI
jgi:GNAT superfamily N-acetyltransferase